jgi:hypothetical protein
MMLPELSNRQGYPVLYCLPSLEAEEEYIPEADSVSVKAQRAEE